MKHVLTTTLLILAAASTDAPVGPKTAEDHHDAGVMLHLQRCLDDASREYDAALALDPPREPRENERVRVLRHAPRVFTTAREPLPLKDVVAIVHPDRPLIAYHLFWDDDIDFPEDNDPSDHEVVWVELTADGTLDRIVTLFHGRLVEGRSDALADARAHGMRPRIDVQWGKHGPMPAGWQQLRIATEESDSDTDIPDGRDLTLLEYNQLTWRKLSSTGTRGRDHALARRHGWPARYEGSLREFVSFDREVDTRSWLADRPGTILVSRWNAGTLARRVLFYNFRPKLEWPD